MDSICELRLNQPYKRNPLSFEMISELTAALQEAGQSEAWGIILGANGPAFSAGHDFNDMLARNFVEMRDLMHACSRLMQLIQTLPQPVIARVQGPAFGAGCQLALSCDMVVASSNASFRTPGGGGGWFCFTPMVAVTRAVGRKRALEMLMTGDPISAEQAFEWGMINRVVSPEQLADETLDLMRRAIRGSHLVKGIGKHAFYAQIELDEARAYEYAAELMASTGMMADPQERMRAFLEKRAPVLNQK
jgi:enoyl-CoA hydratase/carnithine racemase